MGKSKRGRSAIFAGFATLSVFVCLAFVLSTFLFPRTRMAPAAAVTGTTSAFVQVAAGVNHAIAIDAGGMLYAWGDNKYGQADAKRLDGAPSSAPTVFTNLLDGAKFTKVAAGAQHSVAIDARGRIWTWGVGASGQLGKSSTDTLGSPIPITTTVGSWIDSEVVGAYAFTDIAAGANHTLAISADGKLYFAGSKDVLKVNDTSNRLVFSKYEITSNNEFQNATFESITSSGDYGAAVDSDGNVWTFGKNNTNSILGRTTTPTTTPAKVTITGTPRIKKVAISGTHCAALDFDGGVWTWGGNTNGQLGRATTPTTPTKISGIPFVMDISVNDTSTTLVTVDNEVYFCGKLLKGATTIYQSTTNAASKVQTSVPAKFAVSGGGGANDGTRSFIIDIYGQVYGMGANNGYTSSATTPNNVVYSPLGIGADLENKNEYTQVTKFNYNKTIYTDIATDKFDKGTTRPANVALDITGAIWVWGTSNRVVYGNAPAATINSPTPLDQLSTIPSGAGRFMRVGVQTDYCYALDTNGVIWRWNSSTFESVTVTPDTKFIDLSCGNGFNVAITRAGKLWSWGVVDDNNCLGRSSDDMDTPKAVTTTYDTQNNAAYRFKSVFAGNLCTVAVATDGSLFGFGDNSYLQLGIGNWSAGAIPALCKSTSTDKFKSAAVGTARGYAISTDGKLNKFGSGGKPLTEESDKESASIPMYFLAPNSHAPTYFHSNVFAGAGDIIDDDEVEMHFGAQGIYYSSQSNTSYAQNVTVYGANTYGQIGTAESTATSNSINDLYSKMSLSYDYTVAVTADGNLMVWGRQINGSLGLGKILGENVTAPRRIAVLEIDQNISIENEAGAAMSGLSATVDAFVVSGGSVTINIAGTPLAGHFIKTVTKAGGNSGWQIKTGPNYVEISNITVNLTGIKIIYGVLTFDISWNESSPPQNVESVKVYRGGSEVHSILSNVQGGTTLTIVITVLEKYSSNAGECRVYMLAQSYSPTSTSGRAATFAVTVTATATLEFSGPINANKFNISMPATGNGWRADNGVTSPSAEIQNPFQSTNYNQTSGNYVFEYDVVTNEDKILRFRVYLENGYENCHSTFTATLTSGGTAYPCVAKTRTYLTGGGSVEMTDNDGTTKRTYRAYVIFEINQNNIMGESTVSIGGVTPNQYTLQTPTAKNVTGSGISDSVYPVGSFTVSSSPIGHGTTVLMTLNLNSSHNKVTNAEIISGLTLVGGSRNSLSQLPANLSVGIGNISTLDANRRQITLQNITSSITSLVIAVPINKYTVRAPASDAPYPYINPDTGLQDPTPRYVMYEKVGVPGYYFEYTNVRHGDAVEFLMLLRADFSQNLNPSINFKVAGKGTTSIVPSTELSSTPAGLCRKMRVSNIGGDIVEADYGEIVLTMNSFTVVAPAKANFSGFTGTGSGAVADVNPIKSIGAVTVAEGMGPEDQPNKVFNLKDYTVNIELYPVYACSIGVSSFVISGRVPGTTITQQMYGSITGPNVDDYGRAVPTPVRTMKITGVVADIDGNSFAAAASAFRFYINTYSFTAPLAMQFVGVSSISMTGGNTLLHGTACEQSGYEAKGVATGYSVTLVFNLFANYSQSPNPNVSVGVNPYPTDFGYDPAQQKCTTEWATFIPGAPRMLRIYNFNWDVAGAEIVITQDDLGQTVKGFVENRYFYRATVSGNSAATFSVDGMTVGDEATNSAYAFSSTTANNGTSTADFNRTHRIATDVISPPDVFGTDTNKIIKLTIQSGFIHQIVTFQIADKNGVLVNFDLQADILRMLPDRDYTKWVERMTWTYIKDAQGKNILGRYKAWYVPSVSYELGNDGEWTVVGDWYKQEITFVFEVFDELNQTYHSDANRLEFRIAVAPLPFVTSDNNAQKLALINEIARIEQLKALFVSEAVWAELNGKVEEIAPIELQQREAFVSFVAEFFQTSLMGVGMGEIRQFIESRTNDVNYMINELTAQESAVRAKLDILFAIYSVGAVNYATLDAQMVGVLAGIAELKSQMATNNATIAGLIANINNPAINVQNISKATDLLELIDMFMGIGITEIDAVGLADKIIEINANNAALLAQIGVKNTQINTIKTQMIGVIRAAGGEFETRYPDFEIPSGEAGWTKVLKPDTTGIWVITFDGGAFATLAAVEEAFGVIQTGYEEAGLILSVDQKVREVVSELLRLKFDFVPPTEPKAFPYEFAFGVAAAFSFLFMCAMFKRYLGARKKRVRI